MDLHAGPPLKRRGRQIIYVIYSDKDEIKEISLYIAELTDEEKEIIKAGCLINYNRNRKA